MRNLPLLDRLVVVHLDVRIWSGRKKLTAEDLALGPDVPPEDLVSLGSKRVCDPAQLNGFHRLKKQAERVCLAGGTRFLSGFAIPQERAEAVADALDALAARFAAQRATFVAHYASAVEDWIAQHPRWAAAIRRAVDPASLVESRLGFGYQLYAITPAKHAGDLDAQVAGLGDTLFGEVAQLARELDGSFVGRDALPRRALSTFRRVRDKLACLTFVDYRVQPVLDTLDGWLDRLPTRGPIRGALFNEGFGLMLLVSDPQRLSDHGAGLLALHDLLPATAASATPDAAGEPAAGDLVLALDAELAVPPPASRPAAAQDFYF
jgi:hypothetical protein